MTILALRKAQELCEFCPKMCRFACPVSEATSREALSPWGKVSLAALCGRAPDSSAALAFAGCTGCGRCTEYCAHRNDVPSILYAARASAVRSGVAPPAWTDLPWRFSTRGHAEDPDLAAIHRTLESAPLAHAQLFPGCDALAAGGQEARDALAAAKKLEAPLGLVAESMLCCGLKLREGGHPELAEAHAARIRPRGRKPVHYVFLQPACAAHARAWPLPNGSVVEHISTWLARALEKLPQKPPPLDESIVWHDPCALARALDETEAPRTLLRAAVRSLREAPRCGKDASCCGAGGLLPRTLPDVAQAMAAERRAELGAGAVTSSPGCSAQLEATALVSLLARWLGGSP